MSSDADRSLDENVDRALGDGGDRPPAESSGSMGVSNTQLSDVLTQLDELENTVTSPEERREVEQTRRLLKQLPGSDRIKKYTSKDIAEGFVGGIIFALPLLVEGGVFEIAEWFVEFSIGPMPLFLLLNFVFVVSLVGGLLYFTDFRDIQLRLIFGFIPKRLVATLTISFIVALVMMLMWGRLHEEDPTMVEQLSRVTVVWAAAALGASLGDILPGESKGTDIAQMISDLGDGSENSSDSK